MDRIIINQIDGLTLRPWEKNDLQNLVEYANNIQIAKYLTNKFPHPYTEEAGVRFIEFAKSKDFKHAVFAITHNNKAIGGIGLHPQDDIFAHNAELGYWVAEPFWGRGIISACIPAIVDYGFREMDIRRIFARPFGSNKASQRVLEKSGFKLEAKLKNTILKFGEFQDEWIYSISA